MSSGRSRWVLECVLVQDILGFQGSHDFEFAPGLQVIESTNHAGKTSLTLALLWAITGQKPDLDRLDLRSFKLTNKHSGENADPRVEVQLTSEDDGNLEINRRFPGGWSPPGDDDLQVTLDGEEFTGTDADELILKKLGLSADSFSGCGVVLQEHRLKLVTGGESDISHVINDMLGLVTLSEVVPLLQEKSTEAKRTHEKISSFLEDRSPLTLWEEKQEELEQNWHRREREALEAGFDREALDDPETKARERLSGLAEELEVDAPEDEESAAEAVDRLRNALAKKRQQSPHAENLAAVLGEREQVEQLREEAEQLIDAWRDHGTTLTEEAARGTLDTDELATNVAEAERSLRQSEARREEIQEEQKFLNVAYEHLLHVEEVEECPLCGNEDLDGDTLTQDVKGRIDSQLAGELEELQASDEDAKKRKEDAQARLERVQELESAHEQLVRDARRLNDKLETSDRDGFDVPEEEGLFTDGDVRSELLSNLEDVEEKLEANRGELDQERERLEEEKGRQEREVFQPIENTLNRIRDQLVPVIEAVQAMRLHREQRDRAEERADQLKALETEAGELSRHLKRIARAVSEQERERATEAIRERLPFISDFFARVAKNPDYTGLDVEVDIKRDQVTYRLVATSSKIAALEDQARHILSEGDLSAASLALLLGLASGEAHNLGFLFLDDPGQGLHPEPQRRLAQELSTREETPQTIILTHQPEFAEILETEGAARTIWGRWEGGRLMDE